MKYLNDSIRGLILDMDGVLYTENTPIGDLPRIFGKIEELGMKAVMATNNSTRTVQMHLERFAKFGVRLEPWQVVTSTDAVTELLRRDLPAAAPVFAIGEPGLLECLATAGFEVLDTETANRAAAVVMGIDRSINFEKVVEATLLVRAGRPFYITNPDMTFPTPRGQIPGNGAWSSVVETASGVKPIVAGKPGTFILEVALARLGTCLSETLVVGDRLETDIAGGQAMGAKTALVLSGIGTPAQAAAWSPAIDYIAADLADLIS